MLLKSRNIKLHIYNASDRKKAFQHFDNYRAKNTVKRRFLKSSISDCEKDGIEWTLSHLSFSISLTTFSLSYCIKQRETGTKERNCSLHSNTAKRINITKTYGKLIIEMFTFGRAHIMNLHTDHLFYQT